MGFLSATGIGSAHLGSDVAEMLLAAYIKGFLVDDVDLGRAVSHTLIFSQVRRRFFNVRVLR